MAHTTYRAESADEVHLAAAFGGGLSARSSLLDVLPPPSSIDDDESPLASPPTDSTSNAAAWWSFERLGALHYPASVFKDTTAAAAAPGESSTLPRALSSVDPSV